MIMADTTSDGAAVVPRRRPSNINSKQSNTNPDTPEASLVNSTATISTLASESQTSKQSSASNSIAPSPLASRDSSPIRNPRRTTSSTRLSSSRSRKNSHQDLSPARQARSSLPGTPSVRSLSSAPTPVLPAPAEQSIHAPTPRKTAVGNDMKDSPRWPVSPRLRSPPPPLSHPGAARRSDQDPPAIAVQRPTPSPKPSESQTSTSDSDAEESQLQSGIRTPARGGLETVQEVSLPNSPSPNNASSLLDQVHEKLSGSEIQTDPAANESATLRARPRMAAPDGSDSSAAKVDGRRTGSVPPPLVARQSSALSAKQPKPKQESGSTQHMTVETETVSSIPQVALSTGSKGDTINGTLKTKPSTDTIKPKKDKKKPARKQAAVNPGTASSKADVFEAKIANAVDEANTSDSEETFVYDSNPPDGGDRAHRRFHSRTPSATSMASQAGRPDHRSIYGVMESGTAPGPKKGMKFVNTYNTATEGQPGDEEAAGTSRSTGGSARGTTRHHHIGRWGRHAGNGHPSLFDNESPFPGAARPKLASSVSRNSSNPPSPRNHTSGRGHLSTKRSAIQMSSSYDMDDTTGADDERTPLIGSTRSGRSYRHRRGPHNLRQAESQTFTRRSSYLNRFAACLVLTMMFLLVITGAIGFMFATSQPMTNIDIVSIKNVVTSEQVLMFDLEVRAHNPNIVVVTVDQANLEIFAKSEHAGSDSDWWKNPHGPDDEEIHSESNWIQDPPAGDPDDNLKPNVLLGRITEFDSPLTFEGSLFHKGTSSSTGELQLPYPGNSTSGGSERWERIYQDEFDLIVKGVVKYSLPLSAHIRSATVAGRTTVKPNSANDPSLRPNSTLPDEP